ncbi:unnamed protein product [Camellia sinensis]
MYMWMYIYAYMPQAMHVEVTVKKHHAKYEKCFICNKYTNGLFNTAYEIKKKMAAKGV